MRIRCGLGNRDTPHEPGKKFRPAVALLISPAIILIAGLGLIAYMSPIYSGLRGLDYDPAYQYLFNGAGLMKGYNPSHVDHPGTPVQIADRTDQHRLLVAR